MIDLPLFILLGLGWVGLVWVGAGAGGLVGSYLDGDGMGAVVVLI